VVISAIALTFIEPYEPLFTIVGGIYLLFIILFTIKFIRFLADYQKQQKLAQLQLLQSQIMPHFLFNTLNLIYGNQESNPDKSKETILLLSDLLRVGLYETKKNKYSLKEEISFIENYIKLYQHRYPDMKTVSFNINID
jgi:LytS/YehU family sensor histidine kinase